MAWQYKAYQHEHSTQERLVCRDEEDTAKGARRALWKDPKAMPRGSSGGHEGSRSKRGRQTTLPDLGLLPLLIAVRRNQALPFTDQLPEHLFLVRRLAPIPPRSLVRASTVSHWFTRGLGLVRNGLFLRVS